MNIYWPLITAICFSISGILIGSVVILSLIPLYIPPSDLIASNTDKTQPFQAISHFFRTGKRSITSDVDPIDASGFSDLQHFIRNVLTQWTKLPRTVAVYVEEAYIDNADTALYIAGHYIFPLFCEKACQNQMLQLPFQIQGNTQTLNNLSISDLNQPIQITIHKNINIFKLLDFNFASGLGEAPVDFIYIIQSKTPRRLQRRQTFDNNQNQSLYQLIQQSLNLTTNSRNIPFTITNNTVSLSTDPPELTISVIIRYPIYCSDVCLMESTGDLNTTFSNNSIAQALSYTFKNVLYQIIMVKVSLPDQLSPPSLLRTLSFDITNETDNSTINPGPITDPDSLDSIKDGVNTSLSSAPNFEIESASFVPISGSGRSLSWPQTQRIRRQAPRRYVLVIVIRFIFVFSSCNYRCQRDTLKRKIDDVYIRAPPPIVIFGVIFNLPPPRIETFSKPTPSSIPTTTTTTTVSVTNALA